MKSGIGAWVALGMLGLVASSGAAAQEATSPEPPAISDFTRYAKLNQPLLSPSGRYLALVNNEGDANDLHIYDLEDGTLVPLLGSSANEAFGGVYINWFTWKTDDRLIVGMTLLSVERRGGREDGAIRNWSYGEDVYSVARDGSEFRSIDGPRGSPGAPLGVLDPLDNDPQHILMTFRDRGGGLDVARVDIRSGQSERILDGDRNTLGYLADGDGLVVGRFRYKGIFGKSLVLETREGATDRWTEAFRMKKDEIRDLPDYEFLGPTAEPGQSYVVVRPEGDAEAQTAGIHIFDYKTRSLGPSVWRHDRYDVSGAVLDAATSELIAGCYWADVYQCDFIDRQENAVMTGLRRYFGADASINIVSQSDDGSRWVLLVTSPNNSGSYHLYRVNERQVDLIGTVQPGLKPEALGQMSRYEYAAADGTPLFGYLTRPAGDTGAAAPLVVMPHGGPEVRDYLTYSMWPQFLASRGYQVFQPNFRGSSGMGRAFAEAGYRQWGGLMQSDITDGVEQLVREGLVDRNQVCILGASYGGYAALWGGATQPDLYKCVISVAGLSDLHEIMRRERSEAGDDSDRYDYWVRSIGDPRTDRDRLDAISPIERVSGWEPPVLLIHGTTDEIVPVSQSRDMERALKRAGKDVRLVEIEDGHNNWSTRSEATVLTEIETFLGRHLPVVRPAPAEPEPVAEAETP